MGFLLSAFIVNLGFLGIFMPEPAFSKPNLESLRLVQVIFRHGARTIDQTYTKDPYIDESFWTPGYSQLTNQGKLQGYNLGLYIRERYDGFVKETYDLKDVYVLSSDFARTLQTAYAVMAGFYLPNEIPNWDNKTNYLANNDVEIPLPWKSVPVHTNAVEYDNLLRQMSTICPRYGQLFGGLPKDNENVNKIFRENADVVQSLRNQTEGNKPLSFMDLLLHLDSLFTEQFYNMTLQGWAQQLLDEVKTTEFFLFLFQMITYTDELKRLRVGPLVEKLVHNMVMDETLLKDRFDRARIGQKKIYFFSAHDATIAGLLDTLGIFNKERPPFTAAVFLELHQQQKFNSSSNLSQQEGLYLEVYYRNETDKEPFQLSIPGCGFRCPLEDFVRLTEPFIPENWNLECQILLDETGSLSATWIVFIVLSVWIILFLFVQFCFTFISKRRRQSSYSYLQ